jgi:FixJ family two-component response regulator
MTVAEDATLFHMPRTSRLDCWPRSGLDQRTATRWDWAADNPLGPRERQVLQLVAEDKTSKKIAVLIGLTVKSASRTAA